MPSPAAASVALLIKVAVLAGEPLLTLMDFHMLIKVSLLSEGVIALWESALVWSLLSVDS